MNSFLLVRDIHSDRWSNMHEEYYSHIIKRRNFIGMYDTIEKALEHPKNANKNKTLEWKEEIAILRSNGVHVNKIIKIPRLIVRNTSKKCSYLVTVEFFKTTCNYTFDYNNFVGIFRSFEDACTIANYEEMSINWLGLNENRYEFGYCKCNLKEYDEDFEEDLQSEKSSVCSTSSYESDNSQWSDWIEPVEEYNKRKEFKKVFRDPRDTCPKCRCDYMFYDRYCYKYGLYKDERKMFRASFKKKENFYYRSKRYDSKEYGGGDGENYYCAKIYEVPLCNNIGYKEFKYLETINALTKYGPVSEIIENCMIKRLESHNNKNLIKFGALDLGLPDDLKGLILSCME